MGSNRWNQITFARELNMSPSLLSMVLRGTRPITAGMILKLGNITGISSDQWAKQVSEFNSWKQSAEGQRILAHSGSSDQERVLGGLGIGVMGDHQIEYAIESELLKITPYSEKQLQSASYDLLVGKIVLPSLLTYSEPGQKVQLEPGKTAFVQCAEGFELSPRIAGRVSIPTTLVMEGIFVSTALQLDPGYAGPLIVNVKNEGSESVEFILQETPILSVEFHALSAAPKRLFADIRSSNSRPSLMVKVTENNVGSN